MKTCKLFEKTYDGNDICDLAQDVEDAVSAEWNPAVQQIPTDEYGIQSGTFRVRIEWIDD